MRAMRIAVLADTHIPKRAKRLSDAAWSILRSSQLVFHAGDIVSQSFFVDLYSELRVPLYAVLGNNDVEPWLIEHVPETASVEIEGVKFALIHDSGSKEGRANRMARRFPEAHMVVFGHSHIPINERHDNIWLFNPGSATDRRRQPQCTMGIIEIENGQVSAQIVAV